MGYRVLQDMIEEDPSTTSEEKAKVVRVACGHSETAEQAAEFLAMLGLDPTIVKPRQRV